MSGSNGLPPVANLADRQKCPDSPTKRKYRTTEEAWAAARERSAEAHMQIVPYACAGCGSFHLSKKVDGSDVLTRNAHRVETGALRKRSPRHPVFGEVPERNWVPEPSEKVVGGNAGGRRKLLRDWLATGVRPSSREVEEFLEVSAPTARDDLKAIGAIRQTRQAPWELPGAYVAEVVATAEPEKPWREVTLDSVAHLPVGDLLDAWRIAGIEWRVELR